MSCDYCNGKKCIIDTRTIMSNKGDYYPGISVSLDMPGELCVDALPDTYEPSYLDASVFINYCPMCGEKFKKIGF